jgi:subtilisin family serine protease
MATYDQCVADGDCALNGDYTSAPDSEGHGTHTMSTAAGNAKVDSQIFGIPRKQVSGIAPRAQVIAYKVCGPDLCWGSDSMAAVQQAILDRVDVISFSIGGAPDPYTDVVELAFLDAYAAGIFPAASAGNSGPAANTVEHRGPWVTTVAASTENRAFETTLTSSHRMARSSSERGYRSRRESARHCPSSPTPPTNSATPPRLTT